MFSCEASVTKAFGSGGVPEEAREEVEAASVANALPAHKHSDDKNEIRNPTVRTSIYDPPHGNHRLALS
jgi:hypothetical protein